MVFHKLGAALAVALVLAPGFSVAQELTAEEILALLQAQREALEASNAESGDTRALGFIDNSNPESDGDGVAVGTEVAGDAVAASTEGAAIAEELVIDLTIFFEYDSALLKPESRSQVDALCGAIHANEQAVVEAEAMAAEMATATDGAGETVADATTEMAETASDGTMAEGDAEMAETATEDAMPAITENADALEQIAASTSGTYQIIGHTDASGSVQYNLTLSQARADEVVRYMVRECGIDAALLEPVGMGEGRLKDDADPRSDSNRRVEIQVTL